MRTTLLRSFLLLLFLVGLAAAPAAASHLVGGEMNYKYLDANGSAATPFRYRITVLLYINWECTNSTDLSNVPDGRCNIFVNIYNKQNSSRINSGQAAQGFNCNQVTCAGRPAQVDNQPQGSFRLPRISNPSITPPLPGGCTLPGGPPPPVRLCRYEAIVELPTSASGYYVVYTDGTRNRSINNLLQPDNQNQTIYVDMAPALLPNNSPTFSDTAVVVICQGDTSIVVNNAVDLDGDRLIYSFSTPYNITGAIGGPPTTTFTPPPPSVTYISGYSATAPFGPGAGNYAFLNASNGLSRYATAQQGRFVVAVEVKEFRRINGNEVLIGSTRREIQLVSRTCQPNQAPQFTAATLANKVFTIEEGETLNFTLAATDPDGNPINLKVNSVLLDGAGAFDASFNGNQGVVQPGNPTGSATVTGNGGSVSGLFSFNSRCGNSRSTLYDVVVTATDQACGAKSVADVFQIRVNRAAGPTGIEGDITICDQGQASTYTASGPTPASYLWKVRGGAIQGSNSGRSVQVRWNTTGAGRITLQGVSALGCATDSVFRQVDIRPGSALAVTPTSAAICPGSSTTLTASGASSYTWTGGNQSATGPTITVAPTQTTTYTVTSTDGVCTTARQVTVTVNPAAVANAGADVAACSGEAKTLGSAALTGYTYQWSPATGLSSATAAQPTFQLPNTGTTAQQLTYTLTATTAQGCTATDVVVVTLNPAAVANAGTNKTICSGGSAVLGSAADGLSGRTYQWSPVTGLDNPTSLSPTVTLTNTGTAPQTIRYTLTVTTNQLCSTSAFVDVTVNPAAVANAGADVAACSGEAKTLGSAALTGYTYQWSPATGLSTTTAAQPTFQLPNPGTTAQQLTYTLTATTAEGCTATDVVVVTLNPAAVADAGTNKTFCSGGSAILGNAASAVAGSTYLWSPATGLSSTSAVAPTVTLTNTTSAPITTTYTLRVTTNQGCTDTKTVTVTVNPAAVANAGADVAACSGEAKTLGSAALTGYTYQWNPATGLSSATAAQPTFQLPNTGTTAQQLTYTLTATTAQGCTATDIVVVTLNPAAVANAGADAARCDGQKVTLGTPALAGYTYQWAPATGLSNAAAARPELTAVNTTQSPITLTYTVTATTAAGCTQTDQVVVTVNPRPLIDNIRGAASVCPTIQGVVYSIQNPRSTEYRWTVVGGTITSGDGTASITVNWGAANANASVRAFARNQFQCDSDPVTFPVVINQRLDTETPQGPTSVCLADGPYTYSVAPTTGSIYAWQITGGTQISTGPGTVQVQWNGPGTGTITVTETSNPQGGPITCFGQSQALSVTILPSPAANLAIAGPDRFCLSGTFTLPGAPTSSYVFTVDGAPVVSPNNTVTISVSPPGTYTLTAQETNTSGCAGPIYTKQFIVDPLPVAKAITGPTSICPGPTGFADQQYSVPNSPGSTFNWVVTDGSIVSGNGTNTVTVRFPAGSQARTIALTEVSSFGCEGPRTTLTVRPDNVSIALRSASVLPGDRSVSLSLAVPNNAGNANQIRVLRRDAGSAGAFTTVSTAVPNTSTGFTDPSADADARAYDYRVELLNNCGALLASQEHTTIFTTATATEGSKDGRQEGRVKVSWTAYKGFAVKEYQLLRAAGTGAAQVVATVPGTTLEYEFPSSSAGFDQCFRVLAVSADNSAALTSSSNDACVNFTNDLVFYNVITPNNDGVNDAFFVRNLGLYAGYSMSFFNRWGKEVYKSTSYTNDWKAEQQPAGVYYYLLKLENGKSYKGWFEVVK
ncbi:T9SS type B sorting domain-containing protein [Hymenobacter cellulosivorans]|uniref:Gliding motility-associated C-terminal domain-containing protein n=1 Tax=Hymenobacter cellulosivorans TaxID=2932249 RepID=A0ABY4F729_9BACT|nr:gliding motility-associated C-terminal domain-containing protein [Hymenobacter cellulosivorans]UOQ52380.1 gliding motility-associated C-terminal domain-containing protein [Hymenobacter cellulosivorans]